MAKHALAVGVDRYPHFTDEHQLRFAGRDARGFADWVEAQGHTCTRLVSPDDGSAPVQDDVDDALLAALEELERDLADTLPMHVSTFRAGTRLLLFFSGHGVAPDGTEVLVLMANARPHALRNVALNSYLDTLRRLGLWSEIWLFADCCRAQNTAVPPGAPAIHVGAPSDAQVLTAQFYAVPHGAQAGEPAQLVAGHGTFSRCVLEGLHGAAAHPVSGRITAESMRVWLDTRLPHASGGEQHLFQAIEEPDLVLGEVAARLPFGDSESIDLVHDFVDAMVERLGTPRADDTTPIEQAVGEARAATLAAFDATSAGNPFRAADAGPPGVSVRLHFPDGFSGVVTLLDGSLKARASHDVLPGTPWSLELPEGLYLVDPFPPFQVRPGAHDVHLQLD